MNPAEAREMAAAADASGLVHQVAFVFRHNYGVQELRRRVLNGDIGEPYLCRVQYDNWDGLKPDATAGWGDRKELAGAGVLFNLGSHLFDLAHYVLGPIKSTVGFTHCVARTGLDPRSGASVAVDTDDLFSAWSEHTSGARSQLFVSRVSPSFTQNGQFEVIGPGGALKAGLSRGAWESLQVSTPSVPQWKDLPLPRAARDGQPHSLKLMMHSFVDACLRGGSDPTLDGTFHDGLAAQEAMAGVLEGHSQRRRIDLPAR